MLGGIYSDQKCRTCGKKLQDNKKNAVDCPDHPENTATKLRVYFKGVSKRFSNYTEASRYLTGLRFKADEGTFDKRDYQISNPLGFENLALKYLKMKKQTARCYRNIDSHISRAINWFGNRNIKEIGYGDLEDFIWAQKKENGKELSRKSLHNIITSVHAFFIWARKREKGLPLVEFPEIEFELGWRKTVTLDTQDEIIEEVFNLCKNVNKKIWLGVYLLSTYPKVRPVELVNVKEKDIDLNLGLITITHNKERKPKVLALTKDDIELIKSFPRGFPDLHFFRHQKGYLSGQRFGKDLFYQYWKRACKELGIEGVDLYGGTKHSTVKALREYLRPDEIKRGTGIATNKAFERYYQFEFEDELKVYNKRQELRKAGKKKYVY